MTNRDFKTYIHNGREYYLFGNEKKDFPFPEGLLRFQRLDIWIYEPLFKKADKALLNLYPSHDEKFAREVEKILDELSSLHVYFELLRFVWKDRFAQAREKNYENSVRLLPHKELSQMPSNLAQIQKQLWNLFSRVLDIDRSKEPVQERMARYYAAHGKDTLETFQFETIPVSFALIDEHTFAEVLCPKDIYAMIDFQLRECVRQKVKLRICKNCGQYFAISGKANAEYCELTLDEKGRTCREFGAIHLWNQKRADDDVFKVYRREYKKRFAWIKAGRIEPQAFYAWSEQARQKKAQCEEGAISLEEFAEWLRKS